MRNECRLFLGDCRDWLPEVADGSVDCVVTDPPYPEIDRPYGRLTEAEWHELMRDVVGQCRRILKPAGSAAFILQPNYETTGRMRLWLWEFLLWGGRTWGLVQDAYWWNYTALPTQGCQRTIGLMRSSVKTVVWLGPSDCYRDQDAVLNPESPRSKAEKTKPWVTWQPKSRKCGHSDTRARMFAAADERGGSTPFNLLAVSCRATPSGVAHPGATPVPIPDWWIRYLCPPGGTVCDPFLGSGTTALAALNLGRSFVGGEQHEPYYRISQSRIAAHRASTPLLA